MAEAARPPEPRVLLVEDSATQAVQISYLLETAGMSVEHVASAQSALHRLNETLPDLVITDFHLPGFTGDELCRRIRMNMQARSVPILMLTSETDAEAERRGLESGADDYVAKTEAPEVLLARVQTLLRNHGATLAAAGTQPRFGAARLLVVEDSQTYRTMLAGVLAWEGYEVVALENGAQALEAFAAAEFDGVVLDLALPDMEGAELCRRLVELGGRLASAPAILVLTGQEAHEQMSAALAAGADDVVGKSRDLPILKARLRALLRRRAVQGEQRRIAALAVEREVELARERAENRAAQAKAALAEELERANRELRETQAQLVQAAKMASLGQLVAGIAHEVNNPLSFVISHHETINAALGALAAEVQPVLSEPGREKWRKALQRLRDTRQGLDRIGDLVLKLRTFSRLDEGEHKYVKVEESIESVLTLLQHRLEDRITVKRRYGNVKVVPCYPGPLNQVLMNLISNAIDAIDGRGEITVATGEAAGMFLVSVADTGQGIPRQDQERVFEPFYTTKPVGQGTGLGLSISYGIIQRHRGSIEVKSDAGVGTEMIVKIPLNHAIEEEPG